MKSLYQRIATLLVLSIVLVVGLATFVASRVLQPPEAHEVLAPVVSQIRLMLSLLDTDHSKATSVGIQLSPHLPEGKVHDRLTVALRQMLAEDGITLPSIVIKTSKNPPLNAVVREPLGDWVTIGIPHREPPSDWVYILGGWMLLIILGSLAISFFIASKIARPLELLEGAAERIGTDGHLPLIPEKGSREVRAAARALNRLNFRLRSALESRMRLVAAAGHDLRTPMTRMRLRAEFITNEEERAKWLADLEELDSIADSAIGLVREEIGGSKPEPLRLDLMLEAMTEELSSLGHRVVSLRAIPIFVAANPMALKRALRNLLINAATHGLGARWSLDTRASDAIITIEDDGPGIPQDLLGRVFEPFFRVDPARRKTAPGAGLGLAIAREIINRLGGEVEIVNRPLGGLSQTIRLPRSCKQGEAG